MSGRALVGQAARFGTNLWTLLARLAGEDGYARYCEHLRRHGRAHQIPSPRQFYLDTLRRRYARPSRCC